MKGFIIDHGLLLLIGKGIYKLTRLGIGDYMIISNFETLIEYNGFLVEV